MSRPRCCGKRSHPDEQAAQVARAKLQAGTGRTARIYRCHPAGGWHLTTRPDVPPIVPTQTPPPRIDRETRRRVLVRDRHRCVVCGRDVTGNSTGPRAAGLPYVLHRRNRRLTPTPPNLVIVCGTGGTGCRAWLRAHRAEAFAAGLLIGTRDVAEQVPVVTHADGWVLLTADGGLRRIPGTGVAS
ncbi:HNH endonuclease [Sphaerisporangium rhizosphaerae]|uniref:HNH endonuclease n=1 Tax=Sphaerisporangium rhizosphaerae TaxID=2269375 RepID=A0ABW2NXQ3_9ACTN